MSNQAVHLNPGHESLEEDVFACIEVGLVAENHTKLKTITRRLNRFSIVLGNIRLQEGSEVGIVFPYEDKKLASQGVRGTVMESIAGGVRIRLHQRLRSISEILMRNGLHQEYP
jgi:hypothetical protein